MGRTAGVEEGRGEGKEALRSSQFGGVDSRKLCCQQKHQDARYFLVLDQEECEGVGGFKDNISFEDFPGRSMFQRIPINLEFNKREFKVSVGYSHFKL